jgi:hypothetical protein
MRHSNFFLVRPASKAMYFPPYEDAVSEKISIARPADLEGDEMISDAPTGGQAPEKPPTFGGRPPPWLRVASAPGKRLSPGSLGIFPDGAASYFRCLGEGGFRKWGIKACRDELRVDKSAGLSPHQRRNQGAGRIMVAS